MNRKSVLSIFVCLILVSFIFSISLAWAEYPEKPLRLIIGWTPGGVIDIATRALCDRVSTNLKQPIIIENIAGASGTKALAILSSETPDGYTIGTAWMRDISDRPHVIKVSFDPMKAFTPIMVFGGADSVLIVRKDAPWKDFNEFIKYAKANPGKIKYGVVGYKNNVHVTVEELQNKVPGLKMVAVPFNGVMPTLTAVMGNHIDVAGMDVGSMIGALGTGGGIRVLVSISPKRSPTFPDIPTLLELGYETSQENPLIVVGPAGLPTPVRTKLQESFREAMNTKSFIEAMKNFSVPLQYIPGVELEALLKKRFNEAAEIFGKLK